MAQYTTEALSTGEGRKGMVAVQDADLNFTMATPESMGGSGDGNNPEQLFAAGYAACFHSALKAVAQKAGVDTADSSVGARVSLNQADTGFELSVALEVVLPNVDHEQAQQVAEQAHQMCPYSRATRDNIEVSVSVARD